MLKKLRLFGFIVASVAFLGACSSDSGSSDNTNGDLLVDKWWYSADGSVSDLYFNSNGDYEQIYTGFGMTLESSGLWEWQNENAGIVRIYELVDNATDEYHAKITNLGNDTMKLQMSLDGGETYTETFYNYQDTNNVEN